MTTDGKVGSVLVVGGGIAGMQASLDLAESGFKVYLVESSPSIGGRMAQLDKTFPTNDCAMCTLAPRMVDAGRHINIEKLTYSEVVAVQGEPGRFRATIRKKAPYINWDKCTGCEECAKECPVEVANHFDQGLSQRKAVYKLLAQAIPNKYAIEKRGMPPCRSACPAGVNVQGYIALISQGKFQEAVDLVRERNPFPLICGRVCTRPCEAECNRRFHDEPIAIRLLKQFCADWETRAGKPPAAVERTREEKVAIIGSGPAGLTAAYYLARKGYGVTVFEKQSEPGGMLLTGIPAYRLPKDILKNEVDAIRGVGVDIVYNTEVGKDITLENLFREYQAVFVAPGAHISTKLNIPGEDLGGVLPGVAFLRDLNLGKGVKLGERVAVIGGGNVAIDSARSALRLGAKEVFILYRRSREEMPASEWEVEAAEEEGVRIHYLAAPIAVLGKEGRVSALRCMRMRLGEPDASGRRRPIPVAGSEFEIGADTLIPAIGQGPDLAFIEGAVALSQGGVLEVSSSLATSRQGIFAGGDAVTGPATVVEDIAAGRRATESIDRYLSGQPVEVVEEAKTPPVRFEDLDLRGVEDRPRQ